MKVIDIDYDCVDGFAWMILEDGNSVQCCLEQPNGTPAEMKIVMSDCGHDWGICGEVNKKAFAKWGENRCMKMLFAKAKELGIKVVE
jgi:hypothetical protein